MEYYGMYYSPNDFRFYLAHHGVQGMHWGVRRYQPYGQGYDRIDGKTGKNIGAAKKGETGIVKRTKIRGRALVDSVKVIGKDFKEAKGIHQKASAIAGHRHSKSVAEINAKAQHELANASKTRLGKIYHDTKRVNNQYQAVYDQKMINASAKERLKQAFLPTEAMKRPVSTLSGRTTTQGRLIARDLASSFMPLVSYSTIALDVAHVSSRKSGRSNNAYSVTPDSSYTTDPNRKRR